MLPTTRGLRSPASYSVVEPQEKLSESRWMADRVAAKLDGAWLYVTEAHDQTQADTVHATGLPDILYQRD